MKQFRVLTPSTVDQAVEYLKDNPGAKAYAGGTDVIGAMKGKIYPEYPETLISLSHIEGLKTIEKKADGIHVGALVTLDEAASSEVIRNEAAVFALAAGSVASPQIRHSATVAGNLCQDPRCWYYRYPDNTFDCLRKGGKWCSAMRGANLYHSVFGGARVCQGACERRCPNHTPVPAYAKLLREGKTFEAAQLLWKAHPLAGVTGRVCPHNCEKDCAKNEYDKTAVSIRAMERTAGDVMLSRAEEILPALMSQKTGKRAAVVGAGPAGLAAAFYLALAGHQVTVFDRHSEIGGMLFYGVPGYRLPKKILPRYRCIFEGIGIEFRMGTEVGKDVSADELVHGFDAVLSAPGCPLARRAGVDGEEAEGVFGAVGFLEDAAVKKAVLPGERIVVIGGGSVAMDAAVTAKRLGAKEVSVYCLEPAGKMPAAEDELSGAVEEGILITNGYGPMEILSENGSVTGIVLKACTSVWDENGRFAPAYDETDRVTKDCDGVIMAIGQKREPDVFQEYPGVFAMGDAATGPKTVVEAIESAKSAVEKVFGSIGGAFPPIPERNADGQRTIFCTDPDSDRTPLKPKESSFAGTSLYEEDTVTPLPEQAAEEAKQCFDCGCLAVSPSDLGGALMALGGYAVTTKRAISSEQLFRAGVLTSTVLEHDELITEIVIPLQAEGARQNYRKYRARNSVDFPIVSLSSVLKVRNGRIENAALVLGACAPEPLRLREVEELLLGKEPSEELSLEAASLVKEKGVPLRENAYKLRIAAAYVRRAVADLLEPDGPDAG